MVSSTLNHTLPSKVDLDDADTNINEHTNGICPFTAYCVTELETVFRAGLQIRVCLGKLFSIFLIKNIRCG